MTGATDKSPEETLAAIEQASLNLKFLRAAEAHDWDEALRLVNAGADSKNARAHGYMIDACTPESVGLIETLGYLKDRVPFIVTAARQGKADIVEYALEKNADPFTLRAALTAALENSHMDIARRLFSLVGDEQIDRALLHVMLEHDPQMHAEALAKIAPHEDMYMSFFEKACVLKDRALMERTWQTLVRHFPRQPSDHALSVVMARVAHTGPLQFFAEHCPPDEAVLKSALHYASLAYGNKSVTEFFIEHRPELAKAECQNVLNCTLKGPQSGEESPSAAFFRALDKGIPLPAEDIHKMDVAITAADNGADAAFAYLLQQIEDKQLLTNRLQARVSYSALRHAARLSGDLHFSENALFWRALQAGDLAFVRNFPAQSVSSMPPSFPAVDVFEKISAENNRALFEAALEKTAWNKDILERALRGCKRSLAFTERLFEISDTLPADQRLVPGTIDSIDAMYICGGMEADKVLSFLKKRGYVLSPPAAESALKQSVSVGNKPAAAYLLASGARLKAGALAEADEAMLELLARYTARKIPAPEGFLSFLKESSPGQRTPDLLLMPRDAFGNNALDILSAQGRLGDILLPELWKSTDARTFLQQHVCESALAQCDFEALKSGLMRLQLKKNAPAFRFSANAPKS